MSERVTLWGFPIDPALHAAARDTIERIQSERLRQPSSSQEAAKIVSQLTESGLNYYYHLPVRTVPMHPRTKRMADSGINVVMAAINMVIRQFFKNRSPQELQAMAAYLEPMLWLHPQRERPYLVFVLDSELHERAMLLITRVRNDKETEAYIGEIVDALCDLVEQGVKHYYQSPSDQIGLNGLTRKTVDLGIHNAQKGIRMLIEKLVRDLEHQHLVVLTRHIESMIHPLS